MLLRRAVSVICLSLMILSASGCPCLNSQSAVQAATEFSSEAALLDDVHTRLSALIRECYPKTKVVKTGNKLRIEYKVRPFITVGNKTEMAPDFGGLACDIELRPGKYSGRTRLPQQYNEYNFYSVILMAPYSKTLNAHLYTKLLYPSDTPQEFQDRFKDLMNEYDDVAMEVSKPPQTAPVSASVTPPAADQPAPAVEEPASNQVPKSKQIFWKAQRGDDVAYIVGTIPFRQTSGKALTMAPEIKDAYKNAKSVIVDTINLTTSLPYSDKSIRYGSGDKLSKHLSPESTRAMKQYLEWSGETMEMYEFWKPWLAAVAFENSAFRLNGFERVDWQRFIAERAKKDSKLVHEMESADEKVKLFESLPAETQDKLLTLSIKELMKFDTAQQEIESAWRAGDVEKLEQAENRELVGGAPLKAVFDELKAVRVSRLTEKIQTALKDGSPIFVAVDARNLLGDGGLVNRLAESGFSVTQGSSDIVMSPFGMSPSVSSQKELPMPSFGGARLSRYTYPEGKFSVLLPGKPDTRYTTKTGMRQVEYIYQDNQGAYCVGYIILPGVPQAAAIPSALDATANGLKASYRAVESKEGPVSLQGYPGRFINITKIKDKSDWGVNIRMYVVGKMLYILAAEGTPAWLRSPAVQQVSSSLTVVTPEEEARAKLRSSPAPSWPATAKPPVANSSTPTVTPPVFDPNAKNRGEVVSPRKKNWGADPYGPVSPYQRSRHTWGGNN